MVLKHFANSYLTMIVNCNTTEPVFCFQNTSFIPSIKLVFWKQNTGLYSDCPLVDQITINYSFLGNKGQSLHKWVGITRSLSHASVLNGHISLCLRVRWGGAVRGGPVNFNNSVTRNWTQPKLQVDIICHIRSDFTRTIWLDRRRVCIVASISTQQDAM